MCVCMCVCVCVHVVSVCVFDDNFVYVNIVLLLVVLTWVLNGHT